MIKFCKNSIKLIFLLRRLSFYGLSSFPNFFIKDVRIKLLFFIISPINFFRKPNKDFGTSLRLFIAENGPIFIKFGQMLSTRPDLVGENIVKELIKLQDKLEIFDYESTRQVFLDDLKIDPEIYFKEIDKNPIGSASVAQVYNWVNQQNIPLAVKILRPGVKDRYKRDIEFLYFLSSLSKKFSFFKHFNPRKLIEISSN